MGLNGFTRAITLDNGISLSAAYYRVSGLRINNGKTNKRASFTLEVWSSKGSYDLGKPSIQGVPGQVAFVVVGEEFDTWFASTILNTAGINPYAQAYLYAKTKLSGCVDVEEE